MEVVELDLDISVLKHQSPIQVRCSDEFEIKIRGLVDGMWWYNKDYVTGLHSPFLAQTEPITCGSALTPGSCQNEWNCSAPFVPAENWESACGMENSPIYVTVLRETVCL